MTPLRFILVGTGARSRVWRRVLDDHPDCRVVALVDTEADRLAAEVLECQGIKIVLPDVALKHVGFQHSVEPDSAEFDTIVRQHAMIVLEVLAQLGKLIVLQQRLQFSQYRIRSELLGRVWVIVSAGNVYPVPLRN